jgi:hypothetical protein
MFKEEWLELESPLMPDDFYMQTHSCYHESWLLVKRYCNAVERLGLRCKFCFTERSVVVRYDIPEGMRPSNVIEFVKNEIVVHTRAKFSNFQFIGEKCWVVSVVAEFGLEAQENGIFIGLNHSFFY